MNWWQKLRKNSLAQVGASILLAFYLIVFFGGIYGSLRSLSFGP